MKVFLYPQTKFYANQLKMEIVRLKILISQGCQRINEIEQKLRYIQSLEVTQAKEMSILKAI